MQQLLMVRFLCSALLLVCLWANDASAQFSRGNSPYSRYGLGDLYSNNFVANRAMSGGHAAIYRSYWDINLTNPASFGKLRYAAFQVGIDYQHSELWENGTDITAQSDQGNFAYLSLAFPITRSWEIVRDTLRRELPIQWGMGFSLVPYSAVNYDVAINRTVNGVENIEYNYRGDGNKYRVNWSNGITYKGFSAGANLGLFFGKIRNGTYINFQDSAYSLAYDEQFLTEERGVGFAWDVGVQYDRVLKSKKVNTRPEQRGYSFDTKFTIGAYAGGVAPVNTISDVSITRNATLRPVDTISSDQALAGTLEMPLKFGGGIGYGKELGTLIGISYEGELWSQFKRNGVASVNLMDAHRIALGVQWIPDYADYTSYFNRVRYRFGAHYGLDARAIGAVDGNRYQLMNYGLSLGAGFPMRPPKSKSILGFLNVAFEVGYMGHPKLISDLYFRVNVGFALNASGWFRTAKFR